jgi:hypothetical protein
MSEIIFELNVSGALTDKPSVSDDVGKDYGRPTFCLRFCSSINSSFSDPFGGWAWRKKLRSSRQDWHLGTVRVYVFCVGDQNTIVTIFCAMTFPLYVCACACACVRECVHI